MGYVKLDFPQGISRNGTAYEQMGRWNDGNLIRFHEGQIKPVGGWRLRSTSTVTGAPRQLVTWRANDGTSHAVIGTHSHLYAMSKGGTLTDITPAGFTSGRADATAATGYGIGPYGAGTYGTPRADDGTLLDATVWSLDTWGEYPVGVSPDDRVLYQWDLNTGHSAAPVANAPTCVATVVTAERIQMALGAGGDLRAVAWSDQEDNTDWTDSETNQAGSFPLQTAGRLMCGKRVPGGTLLFTDIDVWLAAYVQFPLVYGFTKQGEGCGLISRGAAVTTGSVAVWMSDNGFFQWNGLVMPVPCEVSDFVFRNLNRSQQSKVTAFHNSAYGEVWWHYPDFQHTENNRYVCWSYRENHWSIGKINRTCGASKGAFLQPMLADSLGNVYDHETSVTRTGAVPYLTTAPMEIGSGDQVATVKGMIADESQVSDLNISFSTAFFPKDTATAYGPYPVTAKTDFMFTGRQVVATFTEANQTDWRIGKPRLLVVPRGGR